MQNRRRLEVHVLGRSLLHTEQLRERNRLIRRLMERMRVCNVHRLMIGVTSRSISLPFVGPAKKTATNCNVRLVMHEQAATLSAVAGQWMKFADSCGASVVERELDINVWRRGLIDPMPKTHAPGAPLAATNARNGAHRLTATD
jgi:hypothetical protein